MIKSVRKPSYIHYGPGKCWRGSCNYNLDTLKYWQLLRNEMMSGDPNTLVLFLLVTNGEPSVPELDTDEYHFRKSFETYIYPTSWGDGVLKEFALANSELRCGHAC